MLFQFSEIEWQEKTIKTMMDRLGRKVAPNDVDHDAAIQAIAIEIGLQTGYLKIIASLLRQVGFIILIVGGSILWELWKINAH